MRKCPLRRYYFVCTYGIRPRALVQSVNTDSAEILGHVGDAGCYSHRTPFFSICFQPIPYKLCLSHFHVVHTGQLMLLHCSTSSTSIPSRLTWPHPPLPLVTLPSLSSSKANYPTDLTCAFVGAVLCCALSDVWALGKLCSLGTYAARLEEEWRLAPHEPSAPPKATDPLRDV